MSKEARGFSLFERLSADIRCRHNPRYTFKHKKTWIELLNKGFWPCDPYLLREKIRKCASLNDYRPRGEKLLSLRHRDNFTSLPTGKPGRPEEALERFIVRANAANMYGQMPIGGGKESVDIVKLDNHYGTFIELKPWRSSDSPLYALLENLKNLALYRILQQENHKGCEILQNVHLVILAPLFYYQHYSLLDRDHRLRNGGNLKKFLSDIANAFETSIQILAIDWEEESLLDICSKIYPAHTDEKRIVSATRYPVVEALQETSWIELLAV